jgi:anti-sigma factor RsiW
MRCKQIQELLKSDYLDGEAIDKEQQLVKEHLAQCGECRRLEQELQAQRMVFRDVKPKKAPESIWQNIRENILEEQNNQEASVNPGILERLRELLFAPRPVFALATAFAVLLFIAVFTGVMIQRNRSLGKENFPESIANYSGNGESSDLLYDLGTDIEKYFL